MIDLKLLEQSLAGKSESNYHELYRKSLIDRGMNAESLDQLLQLNSIRKKHINHAETLRAHQKKVSTEIAQIKRTGGDCGDLLKDMQKVSDEIKVAENEASASNLKVEELLLFLPNRCHVTVPVGKGSEDNKEQRRWGEIRKFSFSPQEHSDLGEKLGLLDFHRASKVSGARFSFLVGTAAKLERALINFMIDLHTKEHGYTELLPPFIVNTTSLIGTGNFPKFVDDVFHLEKTDFHLIPTAEVPVTNYFRDEILQAEDLPKSFVAFTPCFRSEAGAYGKDTKGLIRQHQFNKVELVKFAHPEHSYEEHERLTSHAERILQVLELPYRVMSLCTGDLSFGAAKCYDLEVWLPGQKCYREISSCSNFEDFQARRANIRFREKAGKPQFVHTLNGSGLAVGRTVVAILENYQTEAGTVLIPKALQNYMGGISELKNNT